MEGWQRAPPDPVEQLPNGGPRRRSAVDGDVAVLAGIGIEAVGQEDQRAERERHLACQRALNTP